MMDLKLAKPFIRGTSDGAYTLNRVAYLHRLADTDAQINNYRSSTPYRY
jgi:hypothetical protein